MSVNTLEEEIKYPTGTAGAQQACPRYEATCPSQPRIPGLGMVRPGGRAQTFSSRDGESACSAETQHFLPLPARLFQLQEKKHSLT